jgi:uncharacterized membrane protein YgcG
MDIDLRIVGGFVAAEIAPQKDAAYDQYQHDRNDYNVSAAFRACVPRGWRNFGGFPACAARQSWWVFVSHGSISFDEFRLALLAASGLASQTPTFMESWKLEKHCQRTLATVLGRRGLPGEFHRRRLSCPAHWNDTTGVGRMQTDGSSFKAQTLIDPG